MSRSYLYVPGDRGDRLAKAATRGADALLLDLEDAVAPSAKALARETVTTFLAEDPPAARYWVRVNGDDELVADVEAVAALPIAGICLPKATLDAVAQVDALLANGGAPNELRIVALIESAAGILESAQIAQAERVSHLAIGEADLAAELGVKEGIVEEALLPLRMQLVVASAAAGLDPPTGPVSTQWQDLDALRSGTERLAAMGFGSRAAIHPAQIPVINEVFTPNAAELATAQDLVTRYEAAKASGEGVLVAGDGSMVDEAVVRAARRVIDNAERNG